MCHSSFIPISDFSEQKQPSVAIVVPVYNVFPYLRDCLDSILSQTYGNFTIFGVDDGSTDGSGDILDEYALKSSRVIVIRQKNNGISAARNAALDRIEKEGSFDYIAFIDSDDKVLPDFLTSLVQYAMQYEADITVCGYVKFDDEGIAKEEGGTCSGGIIDSDEFVELVFSKLRWRNVCGAGGMVWKNLFLASSIKGVRFSLDRDIIEDELFCLDAALGAKRFLFLPEKLYRYRQWSNSFVKREAVCWKMFNGRLLCIDSARKISERAAMIAVSAFADSVVDLFKRAKHFPVVNLEPYKYLVLRAAKKGVLHPRVLKRYLVFCDHPLRARFFWLMRKCLNVMRCW